MSVRFLQLDAVILDTEATSEGIEINGALLVAVSTDAAYDGTSLQVQASADGVTFQDLYDDDGNLVTIVTDADRWTRVLPQEFAGLDWIRFVSDAAQSGADTTLGLKIRSD